MSDGVWTAVLRDPHGREEKITSAAPSVIVWWLERQAAALRQVAQSDPKPSEPPQNEYFRCIPDRGNVVCAVEGDHWHSVADVNRLWRP